MVFREMIERLHTDVAKLELFCRGARAEVWCGWGRECEAGGGDQRSEVRDQRSDDCGSSTAVV